MMQFSANIFIDGHDLIKGFLGLDWFPSDEAKRRKQQYETNMVNLLRAVMKPAVGFWVVREIQGAGKRLIIMPWVADSERESHGIKQEITNPYGNPTNLAASTPKGQAARDYNDETKEKAIDGIGGGSDYIMRFSLFSRPKGPAYDNDEVFCHELIHAMNAVKGEMTMTGGAPDQFDGLEEFCAVTITNLYSSQTDRALRRDHNGHEFLPQNSPLFNPQNFYNRYSVACEDVRRAHPELIKIYQGWGPDFVQWNPFRYCKT
jgi:hypothetical protein